MPSDISNKSILSHDQEAEQFASDRRAQALQSHPSFLSTAPASALLTFDTNEDPDSDRVGSCMRGSPAIPMRKGRAILLLLASLVVIIGYGAWAAWEPAPTLQSLRFEKSVDAVARSAAEADFRSHPPKARKLTWRRFVNRLANPYQPREKPLITVKIGSQGLRAGLLAIYYPRGFVILERSPRNEGWPGPYRRTEGPITWKEY